MSKQTVERRPARLDKLFQEWSFTEKRMSTDTMVPLRLYKIDQVFELSASDLKKCEAFLQADNFRQLRKFLNSKQLKRPQNK